MTNIFAIYIFSIKDEVIIKIRSEYDLSSFSFFQKRNIQEFMDFFAETVANRTINKNINQNRIKITENDYDMHIYTNNNLCGILISVQSYSDRIAQSFLSNILDEYNIDKNLSLLPILLQKYQKPESVDQIMIINKDLEKTKIILYDTLEKVLKRGENIDNLIIKTDKLSESSKLFYKQAKKMNSCCTLF
jgi:synaptobrevin family protein YKT6